jgi:D-3-phosphoglycerate dehydrogenase / 2-oxoglutarate reductase
MPAELKRTMKVTILDDYQNTAKTLPSFKKLDGYDVTIWSDPVKDVETLAQRLRDTEALVVIRERTQIRAPLIERLDKLRMISNLGPYPHIDVEACTRRGVIVSSLTRGGVVSWATAELNWGLIIAAVRRIPQEMAALKAGRWQAYPIGMTLRGKTLGIYAYGNIGGAVAGYGRAFGMKVMAWGREGSIARAQSDGIAVASSKRQLFEESDVVSIHIPLIEATRGIVTAEDLACMKPTALIVNTSRAGLIESGALEAALRAGRPGMAAVDVFDDEPVLDGQDALLAMDNVVCTPHLGYVEPQGLEWIMGAMYDQVIAFDQGKPINVINPAAANVRNQS